MERLWQDIRFGIRMLFKHPGLSIISIVTFGLGIALSTTVFTIVNGILFKGLPQEDSYRVMAMRRTNLTRTDSRMSVSVHDFVDWQEQQTVFESMGSYTTTAVNLSWDEGKPERFLAARFSADMFKTLAVRPTLGRGFRAGEDRPGAEPVIVIGQRIWRDRFNSSPDVLGQTLWASGVNRTIVGVMPEDFAFPHLQQAWIPMEIDPLASERGEGPNFQVVARIREGKRDTEAEWLNIVGIVPDMLMQGIGNADASPAGIYIPIAQSDVSNTVRIAMRTRDKPMERTSDVRAAIDSIDPNLPIFNVLSMEREIYRATWPYMVFGTLFMSFGIAALFLAVAGLYGVMSFSVTRRTQEMGIRLALGAPGRRLVRLIMRRGLVHIGIGLALGLGLAALTTGPLQDMLYKVEVRDPVVFLSVVAALALAGILASFIPARRITKIDPMMALTSE